MVLPLIYALVQAAFNRQGELHITDLENKQAMTDTIRTVLNRLKYASVNTSDNGMVYKNRSGLSALMNRKLKVVNKDDGISVYGKRNDLYRLEEALKS